MFQLIEYFLVAVLAVGLSWIRGLGVPAISVVTAIYLGYKSPLSLLVLMITVLTNHLILFRTAWPLKTKVIVALTFIGGVLVTAKIYTAVQPSWLIPLGLSYYTFRNIHVILEYYKGRLPALSLKDYMVYNFFLPVMLVGPINLLPPFLKDWQRRRYDPSNLSEGLERIVYGFSKIIIIANYIISTKASNVAWTIETTHVWLHTFLLLAIFVSNAYFQFSGYSDIAIGLARMAGIRINENFNYPFLAINMRDFWTRYHMSLSQFCKDYVYTPVASFSRSPALGVMLTMAVIGLWHELSWRYLLWGIIQYVGITYSGWIPVRGSWIIKNLCRIGTVLFYTLSCVLISKPHFTEVIATYKTLFFLH